MSRRTDHLEAPEFNAKHVAQRLLRAEARPDAPETLRGYLEPNRAAAKDALFGEAVSLGIPRDDRRLKLVCQWIDIISGVARNAVDGHRESSLNSDATRRAALGVWLVRDELRQILQEECEEIQAQFSALYQTIDAAIAAHERGSAAETKLLCREMLDREYDLLGDTRSEGLARALGYTDEDDELSQADEVASGR